MKSNWFCFGAPMTNEDAHPVQIRRVTRLPTYYPPQKVSSNNYSTGTAPAAMKSPTFDQKGVVKTFGMAKFRKSQKDRRRRGEHLPENQATFIPQERPVDVPGEQVPSRSSAATPKNTRRGKAFSRSQRGYKSLPSRRPNRSDY